MRIKLAMMMFLSLLLAALQARAGELECRSSGYRYQYCRADTENNVQFAQQLSNAPCKQGRDWGYDQRGIWVDNGCAAMFNYGGGSSHHNRDSGRDAAAGIAAAVILGALISASEQHHHDRGNQGNDDRVNVPPWAIGHFAGPDRGGGPDIEIAIDPNGRINGMQGSRIFNGQMRGTEAWIGNRSYTVVRSGGGIRLFGEDRGGYDLYRQ